jgi:hypothetical protein
MECNRGLGCWHVYRKNVIFVDGKNKNEPNL